jgi:uncharacterized protein
MRFVCLCMLALGGLVHANALPVLTGHVNDNSRVLGDRAVQLEAKLTALEVATGHQVVVLTVPSLGGRDIEGYANDVFTAWKLGKKGVDDGVLIVVSTGDRRARIEVGYGLEGTLTDLTTSQILRHVMHPRFATGDYAGGIEAGANGVIAALGGHIARVEAIPTKENESPAALIAREGFWKSGAWVMVFLSVLFVLLFGWLASMGGSWWAFFLFGPLTVPLLLFVLPWPPVLGVFAAYLVWAWWLRRRRMRAEYDNHQRHKHGRISVRTWPPSLWQVLSWSGSVTGSSVATGKGSSGSSGNSSSSSGSDSSYSGGGGSSGGGGASDSW